VDQESFILGLLIGLKTDTWSWRVCLSYIFGTIVAHHPRWPAFVEAILFFLAVLSDPDSTVVR